MATDLPFSTISDETLLNEIIYSHNYALPFSMYESVYFKRNNYADKYDADVNPDHIYQGTEIECRYFNIDEELINLTGKNDCISIMSLNICSLPKHHDEFFTDFVNNDLDIIGFCETRLTSDIQSMYNVPKYSMFSNHRNRKGGGLVLYIKHVFDAKIISEFNLMLPHLETLFGKIFN